MTLEKKREGKKKELGMGHELRPNQWDANNTKEK